MMSIELGWVLPSADWSNSPTHEQAQPDMLLMSAIVDIDGSLSFHVAVMICRFLGGWETIFRYHDPQPLFEKTWRLLPDIEQVAAR